MRQRPPYCHSHNGVCLSQGKRDRLRSFGPILKALNGTIDLVNAQTDLILLEDWSSYHEDVTLANDIELAKARNNAGPGLAPPESKDMMIGENGDRELYRPRHVFLGQVVAEGSNVQVRYELKSRPYIGTTTMDPVSAHLAAAAACLRPGDKVSHL